MKNLLVYYDPDLTTALEDIPIPTYGEDEILIKVAVAGCNPKDWKHPMPDYFDVKLNQGDDCAGTVEAVGAAVRGFHRGDRVAGFHQMDTPRGTYAEYAVCPQHTVMHIPPAMSYEEAATIPLAAYTAAVALYTTLGLPLPFTPLTLAQETTLIVNGASGAVGAFALKLARQTPNVKPIIATAGASSAEFARASGADSVLDYRSPSLQEELRQALAGGGGAGDGPDAAPHRLVRVLDAVNSPTSVATLTATVEGRGARYAYTGCATPPEAASLGAWDGASQQVWVGAVHDDKPAGGRLFGAAMTAVLETFMAQGKLTGQPHEVVVGGLAGVKDTLVRLRDRRSGNAKFVVRIADTPGLGG